jgi:hypothetical protein
MFSLSWLSHDQATAMSAGVRWAKLAGRTDTARGEAILQQIDMLANLESRPRENLKFVQQLRSQLHQLKATEKQIDAIDIEQQLTERFGQFRQQSMLLDSMRQSIRAIPSVATRDLFLRSMQKNVADAADGLLRLQFDPNDSGFQHYIERWLTERRNDLQLVDSWGNSPIVLPRTFKAFIFSPSHFEDGKLVMGAGIAHLQLPVIQHWYGGADTTTPYPRPGRLTVMMSVNRNSCNVDYLCEQRYAAWRKLYHTFAPRGVDFVLLTETEGYFGLSTLLPTHAEVDSLRVYYKDRLKLPGILGIQETSFVTLPDGRKGKAEGSEFPSGYMMKDGLFWRRSFQDSDLFFEEASAFLEYQLGQSR